VAQKTTGDKAKSGLSGVLGIVQPLLGKVKSVDPKAAKTSAARGAAGTKELVQMSVSYLKQETSGPLKGLVRYLAAGLAAAVLFATGSILLMLGVLRAIQAQWAFERPDDRGPLSGSLSWVPYGLTLLACLVTVGLLFLIWSRASRKDSRSGGTK
jgi:uncharacterized membrane protein YidH (DUF202 family)